MLTDSTIARNSKKQYQARYKQLVYIPGIIVSILLACIFQLLFSITSFSQEMPAYTEARTKLIRTLKMRQFDKSYSERINNFYFITCDSLIKKNVTIDNRPIINILTKLFEACDDKINSGSINLLRIPLVNHYFLLTIKYYKKQPIRNLYREIGITQSGILEKAFEGIALGDSITTFVGIREMLNTPYYISKRLNQPRYLPFKDTLLYYLANAAPELLTKKLADKDSFFTNLVNSSHNMTVKAVSQLNKDIYYDKILPFSLAILENRTTVEEIKKLSLVPQDYYIAFINEVIRLHTSNVPEVRSFLAQPLSDQNKILANQYFISEINMLHEYPDKFRFQILNTCSSRELYFLLIGGSGELYTSSFLYLYKKFMQESEAEGLEKFFTDIDYYQFNDFISNISGYGLVNDLVNHMEEENVARLLGQYLTRLTSNQLSDNEIVLNAMTMSEVIYTIRHHPVLKDTLLNKLLNIEKTKSQNDVMLERVYNGFKDLLLETSVYKYDSTYDILTVKRLQKNNIIVQVSFFYDDEDGCNSFDNSTASYDAENWEREDMGNYIVFHSRKGNNMRVYMNKPMTITGCDAAQDEMLHAIEQDGHEATLFIHRGHSYHLYQSLRKMTASGQFFFLGSCGGYNEVLKIFQLNPDANIIATRNIGSTLINDPLLHKINMEILSNKDIVWDMVWKDFNSGLQSKQIKDLFSSYIAPNNYIGIKFIRNVFSY